MRLHKASVVTNYLRYDSVVSNYAEVRVDQEKYVLDRFNREYWSQFRIYDGDPFYKIDDLPKLRTSKELEYEEYLNEYEQAIQAERPYFMVTLMEFFEKQYHIDITKTTYSCVAENKSLEELFWDYFFFSYCKEAYNRQTTIDEIRTSPQDIIQKFKDDYLSNKFTKLLDLAEKNLRDENISGFDTVIVNIGRKDFSTGNSGWKTSTFTVVNNFLEYKFTYSSKDEAHVRGEFINVFIHQKKHLIKISITSDGVERIPYIINKDCEKITLKNDCEIVIMKHHGNETIIFDDRQQARSFQTKLLEIREGAWKQK